MRQLTEPVALSETTLASPKHVVTLSGAGCTEHHFGDGLAGKTSSSTRAR